VVVALLVRGIKLLLSEQLRESFLSFVQLLFVTKEEQEKAGEGKRGRNSA